MKSKSFNFKIILIVLLSAVFCLAGFAFNAKQQNAMAETQVQSSETTPQQDVDISNVSGYWIDENQSPLGSVENMGSVDTTNKIITIQTPAELAWVAYYVNSGSTTYGAGFSGYTINLESANGLFNMGGKFWTPIGTSAKPFKGTFIGNGNRITGLMYETSSTNNALFGYADGAIIADLQVVNSFNAGAEILAANSKTKTTISGCYTGTANLTNSSDVNISACVHSGSTTAVNGVDNFYYEIILNGNYDDPIKTGTGALAANFDLDVANHLTIASASVTLYDWGSSAWNTTAASAKISNTTKTYGANCVSDFTLTQHQSKTSMSASVSDGNVNITNIKYAYQGKIRIEITTTARLAEVTSAQLQNFGLGENNSKYFTKADDAYGDPNSTIGAWFTISNDDKIGTTSLTDLFKIEIGGKTHKISEWAYIPLGESGIKINANISDVTSGNIKFKEKFHKWSVQMGESYVAWKDKTSTEYTYTYSPDKTVKATCNLNVRINNLFKVGVENSKAEIQNNVLTASSETEKYVYLTKSCKQNSARLLTDISDENWSENGISTMYFSDQAVDGMNGSHVFTTRKDVTDCSGNQYAWTTYDTYVNNFFELTELNKLYCAWVLKSVTINPTIGTGVILNGAITNPYTGVTTDITDPGIAISSAVSTYATFEVKLFNTNGAYFYTHKLVVTKTAGDLAVEKPYSYTIYKESEGATGNKGISGDNYKEKISEDNYIEYTQGITLTSLCDSVELNFELKESKVYYVFGTNLDIDYDDDTMPITVKKNSDTVEVEDLVKVDYGTQEGYTYFKTTLGAAGYQAGVENQIEVAFSGIDSQYKIADVTFMEDLGSGVITSGGATLLNKSFKKSTASFYLNYNNINVTIDDDAVIVIHVEFETYSNNITTYFYDDFGVDENNEPNYLRHSVDTVRCDNCFKDSCTIHKETNTLYTYNSTGLIKGFNVKNLNNDFKAVYVIENWWTVSGVEMIVAYSNTTQITRLENDDNDITVASSGTISLNVSITGLAEGEGTRITITSNSPLPPTDGIIFKILMERNEVNFTVNEKYVGAVDSDVEYTESETIDAIRYFDVVRFELDSTNGSVTLYNNDAYVDSYEPISSTYYDITASYDNAIIVGDVSTDIIYTPKGITFFIQPQDANGKEFGNKITLAEFNGDGLDLTKAEPIKYEDTNDYPSMFIDKYLSIEGKNYPNGGLDFDSYYNVVDFLCDNQISTLTPTIDAQYVEVTCDVVLYNGETQIGETFVFHYSTDGDNKTLNDVFGKAITDAGLGNADGRSVVLITKKSLTRCRLERPVWYLMGKYGENVYPTSKDDDLLVELFVGYEYSDIKFDLYKEGDSRPNKDNLLDTYTFDAEHYYTKNNFGVVELNNEQVFNDVNNSLRENENILVTKWYYDANNSGVYDEGDTVIGEHTGGTPVAPTYEYYDNDATITEHKYILAEWHYIDFKLKFDPTYLSGDDKTSIANDEDGETWYGYTKNYGIINLGNKAPTPTRAGFEFLYWTGEYEGTTYTISKDGAASAALNVVGEITFYAYWELKTPTVEMFYNGNKINSFNEEYTGEFYNIEFKITNYPADLGTDCYKLDWNSMLYVGFGEGTINNIPYKASKTAGSISLSIAHVGLSGTYTVMFNYSPSVADDKFAGEGASSAKYISNYTVGEGINAESDFIINITPKQLEFSDDVVKYYDATNTIEQELVGITEVDKEGFVVDATYSNSNVGTDIGLNYNVTSSKVYLEDCYTLPTVTGKILKKEFKVNVAGGLVFDGNGTDELILASGKITNAEITYDEKIANLTFDEQESLLSLLGTTSNSLEFVIILTKSAIGSYTPNNANFKIELIVTHKNESCASNYTLVLNEESLFYITDVAEGQKNFIFHSVLTDKTEANGIVKIEFVESSLTTNAIHTKASDYKFDYVADCATGANVSFTVGVDFLEDYWLSRIEVAGNAGSVTNVYTKLTADGNVTFSFIVSVDNIYDIYFIFTNISNVTYELGLFDGEELESGSATNTQIAYGETLTLPTVARYGLALEYWFYLDGASQVKIESPTVDLSIKGDLTVYAVWSYTAVIELDSLDPITAQYHPNTTYEFKAYNSNTLNRFLSYAYVWYFEEWDSGKTGAFALSQTNVNADYNETTLYIKNVMPYSSIYVEFNIGETLTYAIEGFGDVNSIITNITYYGPPDGESTTASGVHYDCEITHREITLNEVNMQYNGYSTLSHTIVEGNLKDSADAELIGTNIVIKYSGEVPNSVATSDAITTGNYKITTTGKITKRDVYITINETYKFNESKPLIPVSISDTYITFNTIYVTTTSANVGEYDSANLMVDKAEFEATTKNSKTAEYEYFNFIFTDDSKIQITNANLDEIYNINIINSKTYSTTVQNIEVQLVHKSTGEVVNLTWKALTAQTNNCFVTKQGTKNFAGAKNVGKYDISYTIYYPNFNAYTNSTSLIITKANVFVDVIKSDIKKEYDGNEFLTTLVYNSDYNLYSNEDKSVALANSFVNELNGKWWFKFSGQDVGKYDISLYLNDTIEENKAVFNNYAFKLLNTGLIGTINSKQITLTINSGKDVKYYDGKAFEIGINNLTLNTLVDGEIASGSITISAVDAGTHTLSSSNVDISTLKVGEDNLTRNYLVVFAGSVTIKKAVVNINLTSSYVYTGKIQTLVYVATRNSDGAEVNSLTEVILNEGVNVGTYDIKLGIKSDYQNNYTFADNADDYEFDAQIAITHKTLDLSKRDAVSGEVIAISTKYYNGTIFKLELETAGLSGLLCEGHSFNGSGYTSYLETVNSYVGTYYSGLLKHYTLDAEGNQTDGICVFDANGNNVTDNYSISYVNSKLAIAKATLTRENIELTTKYTYTGEVQSIKFKVFDVNVEFSGENGEGKKHEFNKIYYNPDGSTVTSVIYISFVKTENATGSYKDFKYAGNYYITLSSDLYLNDLGFTIEIKPITITKDGLIVTNGEGAKVNKGSVNKVYDSLYGLVHTINSSEMVEADKKYIKVDGKYELNTPGTHTINLNFAYSEAGFSADREGESFADLKGSYVLQSGIALYGTITKREVTFEYTSATQYYYDGDGTTLHLSQFTIANALENEVFGGEFVFDGIINAKETPYDLSELSYTGLTLSTKNGESITSYIEERYIINVVGDLIINKAQIIVSLVNYNNQTYDGTNKGELVTLIAQIDGNKGKITEGISERLLTKLYKQSENIVAEPTFAGTYDIYPAIASAYLTNYEYVGAEKLGETLNIAKAKLHISATAQFVYGVEKIEQTLTSIGAFGDGLVAGDAFDGNITINNPQNNVTYTYTNSASDTIGLTNFALTRGGTNVAYCYDITYDIKISIVSEVGDKQARATVVGIYTYNGKNQIGSVKVHVEVGYASGIYQEEITTSGTYAQIVGFYKTKDGSMLSEVKNSGTYFVKVKINDAYTVNDEYREIFAEFKIEKKSIYTLALNGNSFNGAKTYDGLSKNTLTSADICAEDAGTVYLVATYKNGTSEVSDVNIGGATYTVEIEIAGDTNNNYKLATSSLGGTINARAVEITAYSGASNTTYNGSQNITVEESELTLTGQVEGHTLGGSVVVAVSKVGDYKIADGEIALTINDGVSDVTKNYSITISESLKVKISATDVTVNWNGGEYTYSNEDIYTNIVNGLSYGSFADEAKKDIILTFTYSDMFGNKTEGVKEVKNAGTYVISSAESTSNNFKYLVGNKTIVINQKDVQINLGEIEIRFVDYNSDGYNITFNMVTSAFEDDKNVFEAIKYAISGTKTANTTYSVAGGNVKLTLNNTEIKVGELCVNNYNITSISGQIKLTPETLAFVKLEDRTYNGKNQIGDITINYTNEEGVAKAITNADKTNGEIVGIYATKDDAVNGTNQIALLRNAGNYVIKLKINTAYYYVDVNITKKLITSFVNLQADKVYDGTNVVFNSEVFNSSNTQFDSNQVQTNDAGNRDDVVITATYANYLYSKTPYTITFAISGADSGNYLLPTNFTGKINQQNITLNLGNVALTFNQANSYSAEYTGNKTLTGGVITSAQIPFILRNNNANATSISLSDATAEFDTSGIVIVNGEDNVTNCFNITVVGTLTLSSKSFTVVFNKLADDQTIYNATKQGISIDVAGDLSEDERSTILSAFTISYTKNGESADPINVGTYTAIASYNGSSNFTLTGANSYEYQILPFTYNLETEGDVIDVFTKEYAKADPELKMTFTKEFKDGEENVIGSHVFDVTFTRQSGEDVAEYDLISATDNSDNIEFTFDESSLKNKFAIIKNTSDYVTITITGGSLVRYFGLTNIGKFNDITALQTEFKLNGENFATGLGVANMAGSVEYNTGNVGKYDVKSWEITSSNFANFIVNNTQSGKLEIKPRTLVVSADSYDKVYDATTTFLGTLSYNFNSQSEIEGELNADEIDKYTKEVVVLVQYTNATAGTQNLDYSLSTHQTNFNLTLAQQTGVINKVKINVQTTNKTVGYGTTVSQIMDGIVYTVEYAETIPNAILDEDVLKQAVKVVAGTLGATTSTSGLPVVNNYDVNVELVDNVNFEINTSNTSTVTITKKEVTVTASKKPYKVEDGNVTVSIDGITFTFAGLIDGDVVSVGSLEFADSVSGANKQVLVNLTGADASNYTSKSILGDIGQKLITFAFKYYGYDGCNEKVTAETVIASSTAQTQVTFNYYSSISASATTLPTPMFKNNGVKFVGWSTTANSSGLIDLTAQISTYILNPDDGATLYAIWETVGFNITFKVAKYNFETKLYEEDTSITPVVADEKLYEQVVTISKYQQEIPYFEYVGVALDEPYAPQSLSTYTIEDKDRTIFLMYKPVSITVTFNAGGGVFSNRTNSFVYLNVGEAQVNVYYNQNVGAVIANLANYLQVSKTGYKDAVWHLNGEAKEVAEIASMQITETSEFIVEWTPNSYTLTLNANGGVFNGTYAGWTVSGNKQTLTRTVEYNSTIPEMPLATNDGYSHVGYQTAKGEDWTDMSGKTWTLLENVEVFAIYEDNDYTLTINTVLTTVTLTVKNSSGAVVVMSDLNPDDNIYQFAVKTSYNVIISATSAVGYEKPVFEIGGTETQTNIYTINKFTSNTVVNVTSAPRTNKITLKVNNNSYGYISAEYNGNAYASNATSEILIPTGNSLTINAINSAGYKVKSWQKEGNGTLNSAGNTATLTNFTEDMLIYVEFEAIDINITVNNQEKGSYIYGADSYVTSSTFTLKTGDVFTISVTANYGYDLKEVNITVGNSANTKVEIVPDGNSYIVTLTGFTEDTTIEIVYKDKEYTLTLKYAEYDEVLKEISQVTVEGNIVQVNGETKAFNGTFVAPYRTVIKVVPVYEKTGYEFYGFVYLKDGEFATMVGSVDAMDALSFSLDSNYEIYLVYQRCSYTVTFEIINTVHGSIGNYVENDADYKAKTTITESVRYGRLSSKMLAKAVDSYRTFNGWKIQMSNGDLVNVENVNANAYILNPQTITQNTTFIADFVGTSLTFNVVIKGNSKEEIAQDITKVLTGDITYTAVETTDENGNNAITVTVNYITGDTVEFGLNVNSYFAIYNMGEYTDANEVTYTYINFTPEVYSEENPLIIDLTLKYYEVKFVTESGFENALSISYDLENSVGLNVNSSNFVAQDTTIAQAMVQYGGKLKLVFSINNGYTFMGHSASSLVEINGMNVVVEPIQDNVEILLNFAKTRYKVTFHTNYPTQYVVGNLNLTSVQDETFTFYLDQDGKILENEDGTNASDASILAMREKEDYANSTAYKDPNNGNIMFKFDGWSITQSLGGANRKYYFDAEGMYYLDGENKVYQFNTCVAEKNSDNSLKMDDNGNVITNLYAVWYIPTSKVYVEFKPETLAPEGNGGNLFKTSTIGIIGSASTDEFAVEAAYGATVSMTVPQFDEEKYVFYGWSINGGANINTSSEVSFTMTASDVTISLYYKFKVTVGVEESIPDVNGAFVNGQAEYWCLDGEEISLTAVVGDGFEWGYWKYNQGLSEITETTQNCKIIVNEGTHFVAVFLGKEVNIVLRDVDFATLSLESQKARVGDTVVVYQGDVSYGYTIQGISINDSVDGIARKTEGGKVMYTYEVKQTDVSGEGEHYLYVDALTSPRNVVVEFKLNFVEGGLITANAENVTGISKTYQYSDSLSITINTNLRHELVAIKMYNSNTPTEVTTLVLADSFITTLNSANKFVISEDGTNVIEFEFKQLFWYEKMANTLAGDGTEEAPYLIGDAETLAYLSYAINNGIIKQDLRRYYYKVTANIVLSSRFWTPIGTQSHPFAGTFDLGKYKITGAEHAQKYTRLDWSEYCLGVFGYVSSDAEIVLERSMLPTIIIIVAVIVFVSAIIAIVIIIIANRKKKVKKLSTSLGASKVQKPNIKEKVADEQVVEDVTINNSMDEEVQAILEQAKKKAEEDTNKK